MKAENNPFRSSAVARLRYRIDLVERQRLTEELRTRNWRGCILGAEGTGKTTLLEDLEESVAAEGVSVSWVRLTLDSTSEERKTAIREVTEMKAGQCCFFDGGEVLGWLEWRRVIQAVQKNGSGLVATVHRRRLLPVVYRTAANSVQTVTLAKELARQRWNAELEAVAETAFRESRGNAREVFRACYWYCATGAGGRERSFRSRVG